MFNFDRLHWFESNISVKRQFEQIDGSRTLLVEFPEFTREIQYGLKSFHGRLDDSSI